MSTKAIHQIKVPVKNPKDPRGISFEKYPILHPHEILSYLWDEVGVRVPEAEVAEYWQHARAVQEPWAINSPGTDKHIPIGLHGDSAKLWTQVKFEKVTAICLNICHFRPRSVRHSRYLMFSCPTASLYKNRTLNTVWRRLCWSLEACFDGVHPVTGVGGKPLSAHDQARAGQPLTKSGAVFAVCELRGDWEYHRDTFRTTASWQGIQVCYRCPATSKLVNQEQGLLYFNHGQDSTWESQEFGLESFISRRLKDNNLCSLAAPFLCLDWMVVMFCKVHCMFFNGLRYKNNSI